MAEPDWALWRSFDAVVRAGSLSAAGRAIGLSQPTLGRHVEALEQALGMPLFERTLTGLRPNEAALRIYEHVEAARGALAEARLVAEGSSATQAGTIRLTSSTVTSAYILPPVLADLRVNFPQVAIELVPSDSVENLLLRESDIAIRMFRPTQLEVIARKLGEIPIVVCAHESYLARNGRPAEPADLAKHDLVGFDRSDLIISTARRMGFPLERSNFVVRTDSQTQMWELIRAGLGIGFAQLTMVRATPGMVHLLPDFRPPGLEVWLATHRELFTSRRVRAIYDRLALTMTRAISGTSQ